MTTSESTVGGIMREKPRFKLKTLLLAVPLTLVGTIAVAGAWQTMNTTYSQFRISNIKDGALLKGNAQVDVFTADGSTPGSDLILDFRKIGQSYPKNTLLGITGQSVIQADGTRMRRFSIRTDTFDNGIYLLEVTANHGGWCVEKRWVQVRN